MEVMGLVVVVLLFSVGMLFAVKFIGSGGTDIKETQERITIASNTINAFLKTSHPMCKNTDMSDLLRDCATYKNIDCNYDGVIVMEGIPESCYRFNQSLKQVLSRTLDIWRYKYMINADKDGAPMFNEPLASDVDKFGVCDEDSVGQTKEFPIPTDIGTLKVYMKLCGAEE